MSKLKIVCFVLAAVLASVGTVVAIKNLNGEEITPFEKPVEDVNVYLDVPEQGTVANDGLTAIDNLFIAHKKLLSGSGFYGESAGYTVAVGIRQQVSNKRWVVGDFDNKQVLKQMVTKGIVSSAYQLFLSGDNYVYRASNKVNSISDVAWQSVAQPLTEDNFYNEFGHRSDKLTGYILNNDTVLSGELVGVSDGLYEYRYVLDPDLSTTYLRREMITNGGLTGEPVFSKAEIYVTMDEHWNIKSLRTDCAYRAQTMGINAPCSEDITETIEPYDGELPELDFYEPYFGQQGGDIVKEDTALDVLMEIFAPYLSGENDLQVAFEATTDGGVIDGLLSVSGLDISDLSKLQVSARIGDLDIAYDNSEQKIYLSYQDFRASTTVEGVTEFAQSLSELLGVQTGDSLGSIDAEALLEQLTYDISLGGTLCTVHFPLQLGDLSVNAQLYADVEGDVYTFTHADIMLGDGLSITLLPQSWQVAERSGSYPEILGIADLIEGGMLNLHGELQLPFGNGILTDVDLSLQLSTLDMSLQAALGGTKLNAVLSDGVAYISLGEIKLKMDTADIGSIAGLFGANLGGSVSVDSILDLLAGITAQQTEGGVQFGLSLGGADITLLLNGDNGRWNVRSIGFAAGEVCGSVIPAAESLPIELPADADSYADATELATTFIPPIMDLVNGKSHGVTLSASVDMGGKRYNVWCNVTLDVNRTLNVQLKLYDGYTALLNADVCYADGSLFVNINGVKAALDLRGSKDADISSLLNQFIDEQLPELAEQFPALGELADLATNAAEAVGSFDIGELLSKDLSQLISRFDFDGSVLGVTVDGTVLGLDGLSLDLALSAPDGDLAIELGKLTFGDVGVEARVRLMANIAAKQLPDPDDYILNLHGEIAGIEADITADLYRMDIWATLHMRNELIFARYTDGNLYVKYGEVALKFAASRLPSAVQRIAALLSGGTDGAPSIDVDIAELLHSLHFDLTSDKPSLGLTTDNLDIKVNFYTLNNALQFSNIDARFAVGGSEVAFTLGKQQAVADKLDIDGHFEDGNRLLSQLLDVVEAFVHNSGVQVQAGFTLQHAGNSYGAQITVGYNDGLHTQLRLTDLTAGTDLIGGDVYFVGGVLYLDVNGIRQAVRLDLGDSGSDIDFTALWQAVQQLEGANAAVDSVISAVRNLPEALNSATFMDIVTSFGYDEAGRLAVTLDLSQFGLGQVDAALVLGGNLSADVTYTDGETSLTANLSAAGSCEPVSAPAGVYETLLRLSVGDIVADVRLNLLQAFAEGQIKLTDRDVVTFRYDDGTAYLNYGSVNAKAAASELPAVLDMLAPVVQLPDLSMGDPIATIRDLLGKLTIVYAPDGNGYALQFAIEGSASGSLVFDSAANLQYITLNIGQDVPEVRVDVCGELDYAAVDMNAQFVDLVAVANKFLPAIVPLIQADGYAIGADAVLSVGGRVCKLDATVVLQGGNVKANFTLTMDGVNMLQGELTLADGVLYLSSGDLRLAVAISSDNGGNAEPAQLQQTLQQLYGYNEYLDSVLDVVLRAMDGWQQLDYSLLVQSLVFDGGKLQAQLDGSQLGLSVMGLTATNDDVLAVALDNVQIGDITLSLSADVAAYTGSIAAPEGDYTTNLVITVDDANTIYVNIDLINKQVRLRLGELNALYADGVIRINYRNELYVEGNINEIVERIRKIDKLVSDYAGAAQAIAEAASIADGIDLKSIVQSATLTVQDGEVRLSLQAFGLEATAIFADGALQRVSLPVSQVSRTFTVTASAQASEYAPFPTDVRYVSIEQVFDDYFATIEQLVLTNSWKFDFNADSTITVANADGTASSYRLRSGSYVVFYYNKTEPDNIKVRARLTIDKLVADSWQEFIILDVALVDGRVFVSYDSSTQRSTALRATVSVEAIKECVDLLPDLIKVIPQIGELIDSLNSAKSEIEDNVNKAVDFSTILQNVSYSDDKVFSLTIDGSVLLSSLGTVSLSAQDIGDQLRLINLQLQYGDISVDINDVTVSASPATTEADGSKRFDYVDSYIMGYFTDNRVGASSGGAATTRTDYNEGNVYGSDLSNHMNFDSLFELLSALTVTAGNFDDEGQRSFLVSGTVTATLDIVSVIAKADVDIGVTLYADIDANGDSYFALKLTRTRTQAKALLGIVKIDVYADHGGNSYLIFDSKTASFNIVRDSLTERTWCKTCNSYTCTGGKNWLGLYNHRSNHVSVDVYDSMYNANKYSSPAAPSTGTPSYATAQPVPADQFLANLVSGEKYLFKMINLASTIESIIDGQINKENTNVYGVEDILDTGKSYSYSEADHRFSVLANLSPISGSLGVLSVNITHDSAFNLTAIDGNLDIAGGIVSLQLALNHTTPGFGHAYEYVLQKNYRW